MAHNPSMEESNTLFFFAKTRFTNMTACLSLYVGLLKLFSD
jgi:hypothetical protein